MSSKGPNNPHGTKQAANKETSNITGRGLNRRFTAASPSVTPGSSGRLPSLKPVRDLTLGGSQKRTFTPTIPARVRVKEEPSEGSSGSSRGKHSNANKKDFKKTPGRGRGRGRGEIIQSSSVFSMGPAESARVGRGGSGSGGAGIHSGGADSAKMKLDFKKSALDEEESAAVLRLLQDEDDLEKVDQSDGMIPVQLPLYQPDELKDIKKADVKIKVKDEPMDVEDGDVKDKGVKTVTKGPKSAVESKVKQELKQQNCAEFITKCIQEKNEQMIFIQFPDVLPFKKPAQDDEDAMDTSSSETKPSGVKNELPALADIPEGYLGKLQVMKSGKVRLVIGEIVLNVTLGTPCGFLQDVASIRVDDEHKAITKLGHVDHRLICSPDFEQLLQS